MDKSPRIPRRLGFGLLAAAACFFWNPIVAVIDPLPDVVAYLFLWAALKYAADLHAPFADARAAFLRMAWIDALKGAALYWLITVPVAKEQPSAQLLLTFVFAVLELIYALPAWLQFFDALFGMIAQNGDISRYHLAPRTKRVSKTVGRRKSPRRPKPTRPVRTLPEVLRKSTAVWIIARAVLVTLPELTALSAYEHSGYVTNFDVDIYSFRRLFVLCALLVMTVIGIRWLVRMLRLSCRLCRDRELLAHLADRYAKEVQPDEGLFRRRRIKLGFALLTLGALLTVDFYVENLNIIPDWIAAILFFSAILTLRKCTTGWQLPLVLCGLWGGSSAVSAWISAQFHRDFYPELIYKNSGAYSAYLGVCTAALIEQITFTAMLIAAVVMLVRLAQRFAGSDWRELRTQLIKWCVLGALSAVTSVLYVMLLPSVEFIWLIDFGAALLFAGYTWKELADVREVLCINIRDTIVEERMKI
ncbi:MAG: hypothetical protein IKD37_02590 [Clostridia bacterium]|nr:hypothetical protein [Clostridia bacterium]